MEKEFLMGLMEMPGEVAEAILAEHARALREKDAQHAVDRAVWLARGRNTRAITALLDMDAVRQAEDPASAAEAAVAQVKKECGYLFEAPPAPPPYAGGTGAQTGTPEGPVTLASALRERFGV